MFDKCYDSIQLNKIEKLSDFITNGNDISAVSLASILDMLTTKYGHQESVLVSKGAIIDYQQLVTAAETYLQDIQTNPGLKSSLKSVKRGLKQLMEFWRSKKLQNATAEKDLDHQAIKKIMESYHQMNLDQNENATMNPVVAHIKNAIQEELEKMYQEWISGKNIVLSEELTNDIDKVVVESILASWKKAEEFNPSIKEQLNDNFHAILLEEFQQDKLPPSVIEAVKKSAVNNLLELIANDTLDQCPKIADYVRKAVAIMVGNSLPMNMFPIYDKVFNKLVSEWMLGVLPELLSNEVARFVVDAVKGIELPYDQRDNFEKRAIEKLLIRYKHNSSEDHEIQFSSDMQENLHDLIADTVNSYLDHQCYADHNIGDEIKTKVIHALLLEWKNNNCIDEFGKVNELGKAVENIVMQDCNTLCQKIDGSISSAVLVSKVLALEERSSLQAEEISELKQQINMLIGQGIKEKMPQQYGMEAISKHTVFSTKNNSTPKPESEEISAEKTLTFSVNK